ncbi:MAG: putative membrane protein [Candidatus Methanomarinus sp.]|nr:MAG: putative membrane protein [ANME-2 cluster archaeon]
MLIRLLLLSILLFISIPVISAATIHGTIFEWSTFEPLDNALIEVNSTPTQFRVATSGIYSFNLQPGNYLITTCYYRNDKLEYYSQDNITVTDQEGDYIFDILLFPIEDGSVGDILPEEVIENITIDINEENIFPKFGWEYTAFALLVFIITAIAAYYHYKRKDDQGIDVVLKPEPELEPEPVSQIKTDSEPLIDVSIPLPVDLKEVIEILSRSDGRITQKDLRGKLRCSEAKVSLMIADLEARGLIQKIKKGRGNIIILIGQ